MNPIITTPRLNFRPAEISDSSFFCDLLNSKNWIEHIGDREIKSLEDAQHYIETSLISSYENNGFGLWVMEIKKSQKPVGICGFLQRTYLPNPDIGFAILPKFENMGLVSEAARACVAYGFNQHHFEKILAITSHVNVASQKVLEKVGLRDAGTVRTDTSEELLLFEISSS